MGIGTYPGQVFVLQEETIKEFAADEFAEFERLCAKHHISLGPWAHAIGQGEDDMAIDAMQIELTDPDGEPLPFLADMSESDYEDAVLKEVVEALNQVCEKFKEQTGVEIDLWCMMAEDYGTAEELELDEAYWIMVDPVEFKPEVKKLGVDYWLSHRDYVITC